MKRSLFFLSALCFVALTAGNQKFSFEAGKNPKWYPAVFSGVKYVSGQGLVSQGGYGRLHSRALTVDSKAVGTFEIGFSGKPLGAKLYFRGAKDGLSESKSVMGVIGSNIITFDAASNKLWKDKIAELRFDLRSAANDKLVVKYIIFKPKSNYISMFHPWRNGVAVGAKKQMTAVCEYNLRLPVMFKCSTTGNIDVTVIFRDIYGKSLKTSEFQLAPGKSELHLAPPVNCASVLTKANNQGAVPVNFVMDLVQMRQQPVKVKAALPKCKLLNFPGNVTDENSVWTPEIDCAALQAPARIQLFLSGNKMNIIIADTELSPGKNVLDKVYFKYLNPGSYQVTAKINGQSYPLAKTEFTHRRKSGVAGLPQVKIDFSKARPAYIINGKERVGTAEFLLGDPPETINSIASAVNALKKGVPGIRLRLIFRFDDNGKVDFSNYTETMLSLLLRYPETNLMFHVSITDPGRGFRSVNPQEGIKDEHGNYKILNYRATPEATSSMASKKWQDDSKRLLSELVAYMNSIPAGERLIGILPCTGVTWEWLHWGSPRAIMVDYSDHYRKYYQGFLAERYKNIEALNAAWGSKYSSFSQISIPSPARRKLTAKSDLRDLKSFQAEVDHVESLSHLISGLVIEMCDTVKKRSSGKLLTGTYYGYINYLLAAMRSHNCGHNGFVRVMNSPALDIIMAPSRYSGRVVGGGGGFMFPEASARLHRKLVISECDVRPVGADNASGRVDSILGSRAVFEREYAAQCAVGSAMRWFDFSKGWVMGEPRLLDLVAKTNSFDRALESGDAIVGMKDQVAVFSSEKSSPVMFPDSKLNTMLVDGPYRQLINAGVSFGMYEISDLAAVAPQSKVMVFLNILRLDAAQKALLKKLAARKNTTMIFIYGVGTVGKNVPETGFMQELFKCSFDIDSRRIARTSTYNGKLLAPGHPFAPACYPVGKNVKALAKTSDGKIAVAEIANPGGAKLVYLAHPELPGELIHSIASQAKLPVIKANFKSPIWFGSNSALIHTASGTAAEFTLPAGVRGITDYATGKYHPAANGKVTCSVAPGTSLWVRLEK